MVYVGQCVSGLLVAGASAGVGLSYCGWFRTSGVVHGLVVMLLAGAGGLVGGGQVCGVSVGCWLAR